MKLSRIIIAALVGGLVTFIWGAVSHMALPLGQMGVKSLPEQQDNLIMSPLRFSLKEERGFYMFPPLEKNATPEQEKTWAEKYESGPRGVIVYDPEPGVKPMSPKMLGMEFGSNVAAAFFLACIIGMAGGRAGRGAMIGAAAGLFAAISIDISYWNWYRTPLDFAVASHIEQMVGGLLTGLAIGIVLGRKRTSSPVAM